MSCWPGHAQLGTTLVPAQAVRPPPQQSRLTLCVLMIHAVGQCSHTYGAAAYVAAVVFSHLSSIILQLETYRKPTVTVNWYNYVFSGCLTECGHNIAHHIKLWRYTGFCRIFGVERSLYGYHINCGVIYTDNHIRNTQRFVDVLQRFCKTLHVHTTANYLATPRSFKFSLAFHLCKQAIHALTVEGDQIHHISVIHISEHEFTIHTMYDHDMLQEKECKTKWL